MDNRIQITVINPGMLTTIQDGGRSKYRVFGIPEAGPMDRNSAVRANQLVGNRVDDPVIEFTMNGPLLNLKGKGYMAITGATCKPLLDGSRVQMNTKILFDGGQQLSIGKVLTGCRGYLAVSGNWHIPKWMGSCSASPQLETELTPESILRKGSVLSIIPDVKSQSFQGGPATPLTDDTIRIIAGPEYKAISSDTIFELLHQEFSIGPQSNRMGYRLLEVLGSYAPNQEIISSAVVPGTVQITPSGNLVVLMADAQTTGGYPRIANVISADFDKLAQMKPGDKFRFKLTSLKEAHAVIS